jgi:hypothetical protein
MVTPRQRGGKLARIARYVGGIDVELRIALYGNGRTVTAAEMTDALVQVNDRLAIAARAKGSTAVIFFCECGDCLAEGVYLSLDEHEEIRAREDLLFAQGHDAPLRYRPTTRLSTLAREFSRDRPEVWRDLLVRNLNRAAERQGSFRSTDPRDPRLAQRQPKPGGGVSGALSLNSSRA